MRKLVVAPTSLVHSSSPEGLRAQAAYAREFGLGMHSHLLEVGFDEVQAQKQYGMSAIDYAESCGWLGEDVWYAHLVHCDDHAIERLAATGTRIAHCPTSNCRLGSGIAQAIAMQNAGVSVTMGVDGSASAESGSMLQELSLAWQLHRAANGPDATTLEQVLDWGSRNGAERVRNDSCRTLAPRRSCHGVVQPAKAPGCHAARSRRTLVHQSIGGIGSLGGVKLGVYPDHADLNIRIDRLGPQVSGIDIANHLRAGEGGDITDHIAFGDHACGCASHIPAFIGNRQIGARFSACL